MSATKRQMNWAAVGFTPVAGTLTAATGVTNCTVTTGGSLVKFSGDGDRGPSTVVNDFNEPALTVEAADLAWLMGLAPGTTGAATATHKDAQKATGGDIVYTLTPCVVESPQSAGQHRQIGSGSVNFVGIFADGQTNPLSFSRS
jgi:hypothetical protein